MLENKHSFLFFVAACLAAFTVTWGQQKNQALNREAAWVAVNAANEEGLPRTAIEKLNTIIESALADKAYDEAIKAICMKIIFEESIADGQDEVKISRLQQAIDEAPAEMKPTMDAILANWYWYYFRQNCWQFMQRTRTWESPADDVTTWSLAQILTQIDRQFDKVFEKADLLKATSVYDFENLLEQGTTTNRLRPTLFDVIAHNAIAFYEVDEHAGSIVKDAFELSADGPVFATREEFIAWAPVTTDKDSHLFRAIELYQELIRFHLNDNNKSALLDVDLLRLEFAYERSVGEAKSARYKAALQRFAVAHRDNPVSTQAIHNLATLFQREGNLAEAHKIASVGINRFPGSVGAKGCLKLIAEIETVSARVWTEGVWADPWPTINIRYRNTTKIYFKLVPYEPEEPDLGNAWHPSVFNKFGRLWSLKQHPLKSWTVDLPKTEDFKERVEKVEVPKDLPLGWYYLIASCDPDFKGVDLDQNVEVVWVSKLALVSRFDRQSRTVEGFVVDSKSGQPIVGADVSAWQKNRTIDPVKTDKNGMFRFPWIDPDAESMSLLASHQGDQLSSGCRTYGHPAENMERRGKHVLLYTDRAIYRPGQTIHYKGICISFDEATDDYKVIGHQNVSVEFLDSNSQKIEQQEHQTNAYGSFSGSVTAPHNRLTGGMQIRVQSDSVGFGYADIYVEEYKRPKFEVKLASPKNEAKLGQEVTVTGIATAYTGVAINDAKVRWRVVREVRFPIWWYWRCCWMVPQRPVSQEIAHGTSVTNSNGSFDVTFFARPDESVSRESEPTFEYRIFADVTDTTGETRSEEHAVRLGYASLTASISTDNWLVSDQVVEINAKTNSLDGEGRSAKGTLIVYSLKEPDRVDRGDLGGRYKPWNPFNDLNAISQKAVDASNPNSWPLDEAVQRHEFETNGAGQATINVKLKAGIYRAELQTRDAFGNPVTAILPMHVLDPKADKLDIKLADLLVLKKQSVEPGETFEAIWGSGYDTASAYIEVEHRGKLLQNYWTDPNKTQNVIRQDVTEAMRGGFHIRVTMIRENRIYQHSNIIDVPWTNKNLSIKWERFISKLAPGQKETWTAVVSRPDGKGVAAEMVATLYDASLDAIKNFSWYDSLCYFRKERSRKHFGFTNKLHEMVLAFDYWQDSMRDSTLRYPRLPASLTTNLHASGFLSRSIRDRRTVIEAEAGMEFGAMPEAPNPMGGAMGGGGNSSGSVPVNFEMMLENAAGKADNGDPLNRPLDLSGVTTRKNLNETAFFFPHLVTNDDGVVRMEFTMPEALTRWKFIGFAHDAELRAGLITDTVNTAKDLMVQPNPPRFVREGDVIEFTVKVSNRSATRQTGKVRLNLNDARTNASVDAKLGNSEADKSFDIATGESKSISWRLSVPDGIGFLTYKAIGSTGRISDGEEGFLPVLSRQVLVAESLPLPIRGKQTKEFEFKKLAASGESKSLKHQSLTVQMVSNPSWYAVMALPYLMEFPHECNEQVFNRVYANALARHIVTSDPKIERVFAQWRATPALDSPLDKNEDLKSVTLEETPWYRQAQNESQSRRNVGNLFDQNRLDAETARALNKLAGRQHEDGQWSWFPGGQADDFITLYITTGFGRLRHLGVNIDSTLALRSLKRLDSWANARYLEIVPENRDANHLTSTIALYLYGRSFFLDDQEIADVNRVAVDYWLSQAKQHWRELDCRLSEAHLAVALKRFGDPKSAQGIMASIKERSTSNEEMGMYWRDGEKTWWWYRAPIESQAMMIEAFDEVMNDAQAVEDCKVWLLKQKQTQNWRTTKATSDAVYALLLRGTDLLSSDQLVEVALAGEVLKSDSVEAGTGFVEHRFGPAEIKPELGQIKVTQVDGGAAWGSVHWQYLEDIGKITPHEGTSLKLTKELYVKSNTNKGPMLKKVTHAVVVGDELVVRIVVRVDRDMQYVHLKDQRGSGTEPVSVLSQYKYQDGLGYYESTRDTASHFFIDSLPKGTYVFEYSTRVQLRGEYQTGIASIECMYAPEFNSHSESLPIVVK